MKNRIFLTLIAFLLLSNLCLAQVNGEILEQDLDSTGYGYSVAKFWGSHYEMGYAYGNLFADDIYLMVQEAMDLVVSWGYTWADLLYLSGFYTYKPDCILEEFSGIAAGVNDSIPTAGLTSDDIRGINLFGDVAYMCRAVSSWGSTVEHSEFTTISTRRLDYYSLGIESQYHHVITIFDPSDGSPKWINFGWPGLVSVTTGLNEFGTVASLHDYSGSGSPAPMALPRVLACRYALTMVTNPDISTHLDTVFAELNSYSCATPGFLNYYVPDGHGGVIKHDRSLGYYEVRYPHPDCYGGEALYTNNSDITGSTIGSPWTYYYSTNALTGDITMTGQWSASGPSFHRVTVGFRGRGDIKIWFDGELPSGYTPRVELEWDEVLGVPEFEREMPSRITLNAYPNPFNSTVTISLSVIPGLVRNPEIEIFDINGRRVSVISSEGFQPDEKSPTYPQEISPFGRNDGGREFIWQPDETIGSGVYLVRAKIGDKDNTKRVVYLK